MIELAVREAGLETSRHSGQMRFRQPTACKRAIMGKLRRITNTGSIFKEKPAVFSLRLFQHSIAAQRGHPGERQQFFVNRVFDSRCRYPAPLGDDSRAILPDLAEPVNCAMPSTLQKFEAPRLPRVRLDLKPSLDGWMLTHALGQDFGHLSLRHGHGFLRPPRQPFAVPAVPARPAPPPHRTTAPAAGAPPEHP